MSQELIADAQEDSGEVDFDSMTIQQARKFASLFRIPIARDSTKEEIIQILKAKRSAQEMANVVVDTGTGPKPGWTRINLARDSGNGSTQPLYVNCNGYAVTIPRGVEVDVPHKVVNVLNDAIEQRLVENQDVPYNDPNRYSWQKVLSYPFQVLAMNPGPDPKPGYEAQKRVQMKPRKKFKDIFGYWPTHAQLIEAQKEGLLRLSAIEMRDMDPLDLVEQDRKKYDN